MPAGTWKKSPQCLVERFAAALPDHPELVRKPMFGYPAAFIHGNMVCGLFQDSVVARLGKDGAAKVIAEEGATQFAPMAGRSMTGYVVVPSADAESPTTLGPWLLKALEYALTLPPKSSATSAKKVASAKPARQARR